jgi:hypothetical protein
MASERIDGQRPAGGDYSVAVFFDERGVEVEKAEATQVIVTEFSVSGERLAETRAELMRESGQ